MSNEIFLKNKLPVYNPIFFFKIIVQICLSNSLYEHSHLLLHAFMTILTCDGINVSVLTFYLFCKNNRGYKNKIFFLTMQNNFTHIVHFKEHLCISFTKMHQFCIFFYLRNFQCINNLLFRWGSCWILRYVFMNIYSSPFSWKKQFWYIFINK